MRILFLTHYFPPEVGAPQTRIFELGNALGARGHDVTALTPFPHYPTGIIPDEYRPALFRREVIGNVKVVRSWVYAVPNRGVVKRLGNHVSFTLSSMLGALATGPADVVVVETPPLFLGFSGYVISRLKRCDYVCNVADPWLASAVALGVLENRAAIRAGEELERFIYAKAARVTTVTRGLYDGLVAQGVPERKLALITNGVDTGYFRPDLDSRNWRARFGGDGKFVVLYAGTHGLTQGLETVLEAARQL
ncbi:MAG: glycosyltransferase family 4 protein, partial [Chloroflexi bacterium]|nr:glycosyltransferase family 4 protein [Chloroflexota bacterium]